jgi:type IV secretion system protein VirB1
MHVAAFLALAVQCAPQVAPDTMLAVARHESGLQPWSVHDNNTGKTIVGASEYEAIATAQQLIAAGHSVDMGLMQVNSANLPGLGVSVRAVFKPCANMAAGAAVLTAAYRAASANTKSIDEALRIALSLYNTGTPSAGFGNGYVGQVEDKASTYVVPPLTRVGPDRETAATRVPPAAQRIKSPSSSPAVSERSANPFGAGHPGDPFTARGGAIASTGTLTFNQGDLR